MNKIIATTRATLIELFRLSALRGWLLLLIVGLGVATVASEWTIEPPEETLWVALSVVMHGLGAVFAMAVGLAAAVPLSRSGPIPVWRMLGRTLGTWMCGRLLAAAVFLAGIGLAGALLQQSFMILGGFGLMTNPDRLFWGFSVGTWLLLASMSFFIGSVVSRPGWRWPLALGFWVVACLANPQVGIHQFDLSPFITADGASMPSAHALSSMAAQMLGMTVFFAGLSFLIRGTHD